jgi:hypothetical protein
MFLKLVARLEILVVNGEGPEIAVGLNKDQGVR